MYCILISGIPASGKSTMAAYLSSALGMPMFSKDGIKEKLFDTIGFSSREEKVKLGEAAMELMYDAARACLGCGQSVILENNFELTSRPGLNKLLAEFDCRVLTVRMTGDMHVLCERFNVRNMSSQRHLGHVVNDHYPMEAKERPAVAPLTFEAFQSGMRMRGMDQLPIEGEHIDVDTTCLENVDMDAALHKVRTWMKAQGGEKG